MIILYSSENRLNDFKLIITILCLQIMFQLQLYFKQCNIYEKKLFLFSNFNIFIALIGTNLTLPDEILSCYAQFKVKSSPEIIIYCKIFVFC